MELDRNRRLNWLIAFVSLCLTGMVAFAACEVYIRLTKPYETPDTERAASLEYEVTLFSRHAFPQMVQSMREREGTGAACINERGYRGQTFAVPKPKGTIRIVFLGGSAVFDTHAPEGRDWPHLVEEELHTRGWL